MKRPPLAPLALHRVYQLPNWRRCIATVTILCVPSAGCHREKTTQQGAPRAKSSVVVVSTTHRPNRSPETSGSSNSGSANSAAPTSGAADSAEHPKTASDFSPSSFLSRQLPTEVPRLYAKTRHVWIYAEPDATKQWIGYLWTGGSVKLRDSKPKYGIGCELFYAIEPRGYVCVDGGRATVDPKDPVVVSTFPYSPRVNTPFLHRYGESRGAPLYLNLPNEQEQRFREGDYLAQKSRIKSALEGHSRHSLLENVDLAAAPVGTMSFPKLSPSAHEAHGELKIRSTVAYSAEVRFAGRDFLLTSDYRFIPKDRVAVYPERYFEGLKLTKDVTLPLAWFRDANCSAWQRNQDGSFAPMPELFPLHSYVQLTGKQERYQGKSYSETRSGKWLEQTCAVIPELANKTPWDAQVGKPDNSPLRPKGRATWIEVSIKSGWLIAYEGTSPVFTTLISPGRGGAPTPGRPPLETSATPLGRFSITGKFASSTMVAPHDYIHSEVPYAQNFSGPYALHTAYWHNNWGHLMSGGCINLSPIDALYLFQWTEPEAPDGWYGTRWLPYLEPATTLLIRR